MVLACEAEEFELRLIRIEHITSGLVWMRSDCIGSMLGIKPGLKRVQGSDVKLGFAHFSQALFLARDSGF